MTGQARSWTELIARVRPRIVEAVADLLREQTGAGVAIEPEFEALGPDEGYTVAADSPLTVRAYFYGEVTEGRRQALRRLLRQRGLTPVGPLHWQSIREEDWAESWKEHFQVERIGRVMIRPAWRTYEASQGEVVVSLDPGMAFGTGQHPTTRMCLAILQEKIHPGDRVLDLGTGSGVLGLAAIALGAASCLGLDVEAQAIDAAQANARLNDAEDRFSALLGSIELAYKDGPFDLVLANINAATVSALAPELRQVLREGGLLVAGGLIAEREAACRQTLLDAGLVIERSMAEGDWRTIVGRRPGQDEHPGGAALA